MNWLKWSAKPNAVEQIWSGVVIQFPSPNLSLQVTSLSYRTISAGRGTRKRTPSPRDEIEANTWIRLRGEGWGEGTTQSPDHSLSGTSTARRKNKCDAAGPVSSSVLVPPVCVLPTCVHVTRSLLHSTL
jgi:hypothetical protein